MSGMFFKASAFNSNISEWNVANVMTIFRMFKGAILFNGNSLFGTSVR